MKVTLVVKSFLSKALFYVFANKFLFWFLIFCLGLFEGLIRCEIAVNWNLWENVILRVLKIDFFYNDFLWEISVSLVIEWELSFRIGAVAIVFRVKCLVQLFKISIIWIRRWSFLPIQWLTAFLHKMVIWDLWLINRQKLVR